MYVYRCYLQPNCHMAGVPLLLRYPELFYISTITNKSLRLTTDQAIILAHTITRRPWKGLVAYTSYKLTYRTQTLFHRNLYNTHITMVYIEMHLLPDL